MTDGPRLGATETFDRIRADCPEPPLPAPSAPALQQRSLSRRGRLALAIAGAALASALIAATAACGTTTGAPATPGQSATASVKATPSAEASPAETLPTVPTVESLEISAEKSTPEEIAKNIVERDNAMTTASMTPAVRGQWYDSILSGKQPQGDEWVKDYIGTYADVYFTALCGPDYKSNPGLSYFVSQNTAMATSHLDNFVKTWTTDTPKTGEGVGGYPVYQYSSTFEKLESAENGTYIININEVDNFSETSLGNVYPEIPTSNLHEVLTCETKVVNDSNGNKIVRIVGLSIKANSSNPE